MASENLVRCANRKCGLITTLENWKFVSENEDPNTQRGHCPRCFGTGYLSAPPGSVEKPKSGAELISLERIRQQKIEGWSSEHDDQHQTRELASAALGYLSHYVSRAWTFTNELNMPGITDGPATYRGEDAPDYWPWGEEYWKPKDPKRDLVRAAALIAAEIDRLERLSVAEGNQQK